ncbi:MAG: Holliday junction resolvase RuvX [bacterium]
MRVLGLDVGEKTIGVAVSDELGWTAQPLRVIRRSETDDGIAVVREIAEAYGVKTIVVGLPKNMNGTLGPQAEKAMAFRTALVAVTEIPVVMWDERLTTVAAQRALLEADVSRRRRRQVVDKIAAVFILQGYLDSRR